MLASKLLRKLCQDTRLLASCKYHDQKKSELKLDTKIVLNNGVEMPIFGLGTYLSIGEDAISSVLSALENGYCLIDTAKSYWNEIEVGEGIYASGVPRERVFVTTKMLTTAKGDRGVAEAVEDSLKKLNLDYIDQFLLHSPQGGRVLECYDAFLDYQKKGLIRSVGVSNFAVDHLEAIKKSGRPLPQVNQIEIHPWCKQQNIVDWCKRNGVVVVGYSPLAKSARFSEPVIHSLAHKYQRTPAQILIRYSLQKGFVVIPKSIQPVRIKENTGVFGFSISEHDMLELDKINPNDDLHCSWSPSKWSLADFGPTK